MKYFLRGATIGCVLMAFFVGLVVNVEWLAWMFMGCGMLCSLGDFFLE